MRYFIMLISRRWLRPTHIQLLAICLLSLKLSTSRAVEIPTVVVGSPGNLNDDTGVGAVNYSYRIGKYEVTNGQYAGFLNSVDPTGQNVLGLYSEFMSNHYLGGLSFSGGAPAGAKYQPKAGLANRPISFVDFYDTLRFANWLHNGQGAGDTESGAYTLLGGTPVPSNGATITRNPNAHWFLTSHDEWYKAAYYDPVHNRYYEYATGTDIVPDSDQPPGIGAPNVHNVANIFRDDAIANGFNDGYAVTGVPSLDFATNYYTDVGSYSASASPFGTFDQNGNVGEWNEGASAGGSFRGTRGGAFDGATAFLTASFGSGNNPAGFSEYQGFRVATIPQLGIFRWNVDASGSWVSVPNWDSIQTPNTNQDMAVFGSIITAPHTVFVDTAVTLKAVEFSSSHSYAIAGTGNISLDANAGNAQLTVTQGTHEFQVRVNLVDDTSADVALGATLELNNRLNLGGKTLTKIGGGTLRINNDLNTGGGSVVVLDGIVGGGGTIGGDVTNSGGTLAPGNSPGVLMIDGNYVQNSAGTLLMEIAGTTAGSQYDKLIVNSAATLDGALVVALSSGFVPSAGQSFDILDWGTRSGTFSTISLPTLPELVWDTSQLYATGVLSVTTTGLSGDYNKNGVVDAADYVVWRNTDGSQPGYDAWRSHFGQAGGTGAGAGANAAVPEPTELVLLTFLAACWCLRRGEPQKVKEK